jgi:hypothetical protein
MAKDFVDAGFCPGCVIDAFDDHCTLQGMAHPLRGGIRNYHRTCRTRPRWISPVERS